MEAIVYIFRPARADFFRYSVFQSSSKSSKKGSCENSQNRKMQKRVDLRVQLVQEMEAG